MGVIRDEFGRGKANEMFSMERFSLIASEYFYATESQEKNQKAEDEIVMQSKGRNINWVNLSVMSLSPEIIPYKGFDGIDKEIGQIFVVSRINGDYSEEGLQASANSLHDNNLSTSKAREYGYTVDYYTSVEWSLLADSWSRGGIYFYALYLFVFIMLGTLVENKFIFKQSLKTLPFLILVYSFNVFTGFGAKPFYEAFREIVLKLIMVYFLLVIINFVINNNQKSGRTFLSI